MIAAQNSNRTAPAKVGRPWSKGQSGNPGGRPKIAVDVKAEAGRHTKEALDRLVHWMRSDDPQASIRASTALLDRGCGKPAQAVHSDLPAGPVTITIDPFKNHREVMEEARRENEKKAVNTSEETGVPDLNGQLW